MRVESTLSMKENIRLEAVHGRVIKVFVSGLTAARACRLATEYVTALTLEPPVMNFTILLGVGSIGWLVSRIASVFLPFYDRKPWKWSFLRRSATARHRAMQSGVE